MKIAVFCSSRMGNSTGYAQTAKDLGTFIAAGGHELVYGGEEYGLMAVIADAVLSGGGAVTGVVPDIPLMMANVHPRLTRCIYVKDMAERKQTMLALADACFALPGGVGTLDEFSEVLCLNKIGLTDKPMILLGTGGFYEPLRAYFDNMVRAEMMEPGELSQLLITESLEEASGFLEKKAGI